MRARTKMLLLSVLCVVLSLEFGVATPQGNRLKETRLQNEDKNEINVEKHMGEPANQNNMPKIQNELISSENHSNVLLQNYNNEQFNTNNNPAVSKNVNEQPNLIPVNKEYNQVTAARNVNTLNDQPSSYIASLPQVKKYQSFRPKNGEKQEANMPRMGDILSEVNNPKNDFSAFDSNTQIIQERNPANQVMHKNIRQNSKIQENYNDKKKENSTQFDVPVATPEYIKSLFNEYKHTQKNNEKSTPLSLPRNDISNKNFQTNSPNVNEATFQNPSAEILYETGQAKPYEISNEALFNSRRGNTYARNMLNDKQRLKNLYLSSKPTKHYMVVYPDGRVEQMDQLDKIQKNHPNYVMLSSKELMQHGEKNHKVSTGSQGSEVKQNLPITTTTTTTTTTMKPQLYSIKKNEFNQTDKVPQTVNEKTLPVPIEPLSVATESPIITTSEVTKTNNVAKPSKDIVLTKLTSENDVQKQLQESEINNSQDKNYNENTNSEAILTTSDISSVQISTTSTTETPGIEDTLTTVRSTLSTPTDDTEILNQNISNSFETSNNTNSSKEPENSISTYGSNLTNTTHESVVAGQNITPTLKQESNEEDERTKYTTTTTSDLNTFQENSYTINIIETSNENYETNTSNSSSSWDSSSNKEESNSTTQLNNATVIAFEDGTDSDGSTLRTETIIIDQDNESSAQNPGFNNVTSSNDSTPVVSNSNKTDITNSSTDNIQNNTNSLNVTSINSLSNKTLDFPEKIEDNTESSTIKIVSNVTNSEDNGTENEIKNIKPETLDINSDPTFVDGSSYNISSEAYTGSSTQKESNSNKTIITNVKQDSAKYTDDRIDVSKEDVTNEEDANTAKDASNGNYKETSVGGAMSSNEADTTAQGTDSNDLYYINSPQKGVIEDDEDDDTNNETISEITNTNDNLETESQSNDENNVNEPSFWFNASDIFWNKLMTNNEHNSFYFLFPRPIPNTKETKKIMYPNGTVVIETTETVNNDDGETSSSKAVLTCGNCTTCEKTL